MSRLIRKDHLREVLLALWASPRGDRHIDYFHALTLVALAFGLDINAPPTEVRLSGEGDWVYIIGGNEQKGL